MEVIIVSLKSQHCHFYSRVSKKVWNTEIQSSWRKLGELLAHLLFLNKNLYLYKHYWVSLSSSTYCWAYLSLVNTQFQTCLSTLFVF